MKPKHLFFLVNISLAVTLGAFLLLGKIALAQLPIVAVVSLILLNGAVAIGLRARKK